MTGYFTADTTHHDGCVEVTLDGELDLGGREAFSDALAPLLARYDLGQVTIDCTDLAFIDGSGLGVFAAFLSRGKGSGRLTLRNPSPMFRKIIDVMNMNDAFIIESMAST
jgi:anti-anti-sigma factor